MRRLALALLVLGTAISCGRDATHDGHSHEKESAEPEPVSITKWTATHELFVEFPPPVAGKPVEFHAHVTALEGFRALTEGRFRKHVKAVSDADAAKLTLLDDALAFITQDDVIHRRVFDRNHRSFVPNFGCYIRTEVSGKIKAFAVSRQMVLFAVERRKAWRMLQSKAGVVNRDYLAQKAFLAKLDKGEIPLADARTRTRELLAAATA